MNLPKEAAALAKAILPTFLLTKEEIAANEEAATEAILAFARQADAEAREDCARIVEEHRCDNCGTWFHPDKANNCCARPYWGGERSAFEAATAIRASIKKEGHAALSTRSEE